MNKRKIMSFATGLTIVLLCFNALDAVSQSAPTLTKEELLDILERPDLVIIDVRTTGNWQASDTKIKGAHRGIPENFDSWFKTHPKNKILVLY